MIPKQDPYLIENYSRLSHSKLWAIQRDYFIHRGIDAFTMEVPFYISSNAYIAQRYALLIHAFIDEWFHTHPEDQGKTFKILELGAGTAKFSFYFLKAFSFLEKERETNVSWKYIISDIVESNINFCKDNQDFKTFIDSGNLDFANINLDSPFDFQLKSDLPLIIIGNYVFDCLKQDLFVKKEGRLQEVQVEIKSRYPDFNQDKPENLNELKFKFQNIDIQCKNYYENNILNNILLNYEGDLKEGTMIPMPVSAFSFLEYIKSSNSKVFFICGDKGIALQNNLLVSSPQGQYTYDGCYSYYLNFHALGEFCIQQGGSYVPTQYNNSFKINLLSMGFDLNNFKATTTCYRTFLESCGADEFCIMMGEFKRSGYRFDPKVLIAFLRMSYWDPDVYSVIHDRLIEMIMAFPVRIFKDVIKDMERVEQNIYNLKTNIDFYNLLGIFYQSCNMIEKAIKLYEKSLVLYGENAASHHNLALIYEKMGNSDKAIKHYQLALKLNKKDSYAKKRLNILKGNFIALLWLPALKLSTLLLGFGSLFWIFNK